MTDESHPEPSVLPPIADLRLADLGACLDAGIRDFMRAPQFGLFFSGVYVIVGIAMLTLGAGHMGWVLAFALGFPLVAPFVAVGLYEVSRRIEAGAPLEWGAVLGVVWNERRRQVPWVGAIIIFLFMFWVFLVHAIFALMMGLSALTNITAGLEALLTAQGLSMLATEVVIGGAYAFFIFSITVVSLPLLLHRELDFVTAMITSFRVVLQNPVVMLAWAGIIAVVTVAAMLPWFLGLLVVMPVLGHASWHIYRRALPDADQVEG